MTFLSLDYNTRVLVIYVVNLKWVLRRLDRGDEKYHERQLAYSHKLNLNPVVKIWHHRPFSLVI